MQAADEIIARLGLRPHPEEGGYFLETYRSSEQMERGTLPARYSGDRAFGTAIYYLLTPESFSTLHRLASDEIFHFYLGDPVEMLQLLPDGSHRVIVLGADIAAEMRLQVIVQATVWQGARLAAGGRWALLGCTVAPGFEYADYESGRRDELGRIYPAARNLIGSLTRW
jgi:predicted cupin superfamily sugar epimerase